MFGKARPDYSAIVVPALKNAALWFACLGLISACVPVFQELQVMQDNDPPAYIESRVVDGSTLALSFSEPVFADMESFSASEGVNILGISDGQTELTLTCSGCDIAGAAYEIQGKVYDAQSNELWFSIPFYGFNPNPAELVITEIIVENSSTRYEKAEALVTGSGNIGGLTVYNGSPGRFLAMLVLGDQLVQQGDYLIFHFRSNEQSPDVGGEINEYGQPENGVLDEAFSSQAVNGARDFWVPGYQGLSDSNGAVCIAARPDSQSQIMDCFVYSNRVYDELADHGSFGTAYTWEVMQDIQHKGAWSFSGENITPDDCIKTEASTSTRSLNRYEPLNDSNSPEDWYITVTGGSSFGAANNSEVYQP